MEIKKINRSDFLSEGAKSLLALSGAALFGTSFLKFAFADDKKSENPLIVIFLRGGCDGLNFLCPIDGSDRKAYEESRPNLKIALSGADSALPLQEKFALHPSAKDLHKLFVQKKLAFVHATGLNVNTRSHFDAQSFMEQGTTKNIGSGWLARYLASEISESKKNLPAVVAGPLVPSSLFNFERAISVNDISRLDLGGRKNLAPEQQEILDAIYSDGNSRLHRAGKEALSALRILQGKNIAKTREYPKTEIAGRLHTLSQLLQMDLGVKVATVDMGGWDTHKYQGTGTEGQFAKQVEMLSEGLNTFWEDIHSQPNPPKVNILVISEFGRRLRENANRGTDHGHGGIAFLLGDDLNGGKIFGKWPGLETENLYERADLAVATDYREIISSLLDRKYQSKNLNQIFPEYKYRKSLLF